MHDVLYTHPHINQNMHVWNFGMYTEMQLRYSNHASKRTTISGIEHSNLNYLTDTIVSTRYYFHIRNC